jgi:ADP-ribose pyrophosphatase YjhB (NUDIX family)
MNFCSNCGSPVSWIIPTGDNRQRHVCNNHDCASIHYQNPRIITGCLPIHEDKVLLCKRAIEPRYGYWTLPAGFMENGETTQQGAERESWEEARAKLHFEQLYTVFDLPHIHQVYFVYKARLANLDFGPGDESLDVRLFTEAEIPWNDLAFTVIEETLKCYFEDRKQQQFIFRARALAPRKK